MLGTLGRYLRFMGYDTLSANDMTPGNPKEDSLLLGIAMREGRVLLTRDRELARRGGDKAFFICPTGIIPQLQDLVNLGLVKPRLAMNRCSLCNEKLRLAHKREIQSTCYVPEQRDNYTFFWCVHCRKLYWAGSHAQDLENRLKIGLRMP
jgi:uncharacterized protein with PIN domain